eukprot:scaffold10197_cov270-Chaetoceros_neogracile.AAC.15
MAPTFIRQPTVLGDVGCRLAVRIDADRGFSMIVGGSQNSVSPIATVDYVYGNNNTIRLHDDGRGPNDA